MFINKMLPYYFRPGSEADVVAGPSAQRALPPAAPVEPQKPEQSTTADVGSKIDERGSTVVIYKNALGERLIVAEDQLQARKQQQDKDESDYRTAAWDSSSLLVIDDMRQLKVPIRTPPGRPASAKQSSRSSNESNTSSVASSKRCRQRKWGEILQQQQHQSPRGSLDQQSGSNGKTFQPPRRPSTATNDRITTINYEISRRDSKKGAAQQISRETVPPTTLVGREIQKQKCDPKTYVLNLKIQVPSDLDGKQKNDDGKINAKL